jgi:hypothetical protein
MRKGLVFGLALLGGLLSGCSDAQASQSYRAPVIQPIGVDDVRGVACYSHPQYYSISCVKVKP